jgi:hypothetical protein
MPCVSVKDMFFLVHGPSKHRKLVAMFYGFFDGSNTHDGAKVWSLCGFLGEETAFTELYDEWNRVLDKPCWPKRLSRFHMVDCVHGDREFVGWSFAERLGMFGELASLIMAAPLAALGSIVITEDFAKLESAELALLKSEGLGESLDLSVQYIFQRSIAATRATDENRQIGFIFDDENPRTRNRCFSFYDLYRNRFVCDPWMAGIGFGSSVKFPPLQAADILAYSTFRFTMLRYPNIPQPDFPVIPGFQRMIEGMLNEGGGFDLDSMKKLASQIRDRRTKGASA